MFEFFVTKTLETVVKFNRKSFFSCFERLRGKVICQLIQHFSLKMFFRGQDPKFNLFNKSVDDVLVRLIDGYSDLTLTSVSFFGYNF